MTELSREKKMQQEAFDILLSCAAERAGEELLEELETGEPVEFSQRHQKEMEKLFKQMEEHRPLSFYVKRIAAAFVILAVITGTSVMCVEAWRTKFMNFFTKTSQTNTEVRYGEHALKNNTYSTELVTLKYIPEGMRLEEEILREKQNLLAFVDEEKYFRLRITITDTISNVDTENKNTETIFINGTEAYLQMVEEEYALKWSTEKKAYTLTGNLSKETLLRIADNIY